jgi:2'-5' RNA ligase
MRVYPAIVPPTKLVTKIQNFANSLADPRLGITSERASGPHITLKGPQYPDELEAWLTAARRAVTGIPPFEVVIGEPTFLARGILALLVSAPALHELNARLAKALAAYNQPGITYFDFDLYTPHISLAYTTSPMHEQRIELHDRVKSELLPLPAFKAESVAVFTRNDTDFQYRLSHRLPLTPA